MSNFRNTAGCLNRLVGCQAEEPDVKNIELKYLTCRLGEKEGEAGATVNYRGEEHVFSATELMAMFLGKLKMTTQNEIKSAMSDCVVAVPVYFTDAQRRAMLDACSIAGLNCLRLINDTTATALCYGLTKNEMFGEKPKNVCFVDIGYSSMKVTIVAFTKGHLEIKGTAFDKHLGGRDFDEALADHFAESIQKAFATDIKGSVRTVLRLRTACEKIKKVLSSISSTKADLETESRDFPLQITREAFESLAQPLLAKVQACLNKALASAGIDVDHIDAVEVVGGSTRIPAVKQIIVSTIGKEISTTLNQDEAVARGCAFQCAIESPSFRVREFGVRDIISYPVKVSWGGPEGAKDVVLFPAQSHLPSLKPLFTSQALPLTIQALYSQPEDLPAGTNPLLGTYTIASGKAAISPDSKIRVDVAVSGHGLVGVKKALLIEERLEEVAGPEPDSPKETKKIIREYELTVSAKTASRTTAEIAKMREAEFGLALTDKYAQELDDSRNSLEEYIYEMRSKLEGVYQPFTVPGTAEAFVASLSSAEEWLYSEHEAENKEMYQAKLEELKKVGQPIATRAKEHEGRPHAEDLLRQLTAAILQKAADLDLVDEDLAKIQSECASRIAWLSKELTVQAALPKYADAKLTCARINEQREKLLSTTSTLFSKAKPKKTESPAPADSACSDECCDGATPCEPEAPVNMDID